MASPSEGLWLWFGAQVGAWGGGGVEAVVGGSCSPTYFPSPARCHSLFHTQVGVCCSHGSWVGRDSPPTFLSLFDQVFGSKRSQEELVVELP